METQAIYSDIDQYVQTDLLCWASYPNNPNDGPFYLFPLYAVNKGNFERIDETSFPDNGSFTAMPVFGIFSSMEQIEETYGKLVVARIQASSFNRNDHYNGADIPSQYMARFNNRRDSDLILHPLNKSRVIEGLYQIVKVTEAAHIDFRKPLKTPVQVASGENALFCPQIFMQQATADGPEYYGPFTYTLDQKKGLMLHALDSLDYRVYKLGSIPAAERIALNTGSAGFYEDLGTFLRRDYVESEIDRIGIERAFDWMPDEKMSLLFRSLINASNKMKLFDKEVLRQLKSAIYEFSENESIANLDSVRRQRLSDAVDDMDATILFNRDVLNQIFSRIDDKRLESIVTSDEVYPQIKDRLIASAGIKEKLDEERANLEHEIEMVRARCEDARKQEEQAKEARAAAQKEEEEARANAHETIQNILSSRQTEIEQLDVIIEERKTKAEQVDNEYQATAAQKEVIEQQIDELLSGLQNEKQLAGKILESSLLKRVVSSVSKQNQNSLNNIEVPAVISTCTNEESIAPKELVEEIADRIEAAGRSLSNNDVVNMLTCLMQGYITTFSGMPGTGKTSMCNILAGALGLTQNSADTSRFTQINVENGWTSFKDYIGYHNPIAKTYEKSIPQVFDAMHRLSLEKTEAGIAPYFFLLDEANLSPIEHYWGPFMHACDTFQTSGGRLALGSNEDWQLPGHVRFMATVNYDHTTESLSPRFLDRSWVITLDALNSVDEASVFNPEILKASNVPFSYEKLMDVFGTSSLEINNPDTSALLRRLLNVCKENGMPVSYRSVQMMRRYLAAATPLMSFDSANPYVSLDFAFAQKVLPSIAGPIEKIGPLVDALLAECQSMSLTTKQLENMKKHGEDSGYYQYFI